VNRLWRTEGCDTCARTGYRGRTGIYELMLVDDDVRRAIHDHIGEPSLRELAARKGLRTLAMDGARWLADGTTSLSELLRVTGAGSNGG
jgi:general secretion pathway protein E